MHSQDHHYGSYQKMFECTSQDLSSSIQRQLAHAALYLNQSACANSQIDHYNGQLKCQINSAGIPKIKNNTLYEHFLNSNGFTAQPQRVDNFVSEIHSLPAKLTIQQIFNLNLGRDERDSVMMASAETRSLPLPFQNLSGEYQAQTRIRSDTGSSLDNTMINTRSTSALFVSGGYPKNATCDIDFTERALLHQMLLRPYNCSVEY